MNTIRLVSNKDEYAIHPSELLLPLNAFSNLVNRLHNFEVDFETYKMRRLNSKEEPDFSKAFGRRLQLNRNMISRNEQNNAVQLKAMSKESPYWLDLIIQVSPEVLDILILIVESNENVIEERMKDLLSRFSSFNLLSDDQKDRIVRAIISHAKFILRFVRLNFKNDK